MARSLARPTLLFAAGVTIAGCGLMYDYSDYADAPAAAGGGGTGTATTTTTTTTSLVGGGGSGATGGTGTATTTTTTSAGGGGGTAGTGGTGGSGGTGGTGGTVPEDCLDGLDNDEDGLTDCEDTEDCASADFTCVPLPEGNSWGNWSDPFLAFSGLNPPGCLGQFDQAVPIGDERKFLFVPEPPADACDCMCDAPSTLAGDCLTTVMTLNVQENTSSSCAAGSECGGVAQTFVNPGNGPGACQSISLGGCANPNSTAVVSMNLPQLPVRCDPAEPVAQSGLPNPIWFQAENRLCSSAVGSCRVGGTTESRCIPTPPGTELLRVCVAQPYEDGLTCPDTYPEQVILFPDSAGFTDNRTCASDPTNPCACGAVQAYCKGWVQIFRDTLCNTLSEQKQVPPAVPMCAISTTTPRARWIPTGNQPGDWELVNAGEQCATSGTAVVQGDVVPSGAPPAALVCCIPSG